jgi:hypothetical protein
MLHFKILRKKMGISHLGIRNTFVLYVDVLGKTIILDRVHRSK